MAIYTPRGLKVRIAVPCAFGLMARLSPKVSPFRVLKTTEGLQSIPGLLALIAGLIAFSMDLPPIQVGLLVCGAQLLGVLINLFGFYVIPGLVSLATVFSYVAGYGILLAAIGLVGFFTVGWQGVLAFFIGKAAAGLASTVLGFWQTSRYHRLVGHAFTPSEVHFFNAYRLHASRIGVTTDIDLHEDETHEDQWGPTFAAFAAEWPEVVQRFRVD